MTGTVMSGTVMIGTVTEFSDASGLGVITADDGRSYPFHVIEIADATRTVDVGRSVSFRALPKFGRLEAAGVCKV